MLKECSSDCANGVHDVSAAAALGASVALVVMSEAAHGPGQQLSNSISAVPSRHPCMVVTAP